ncbi:TIGR00266 family protein [Spirochaeta dissipatitropha]
MQYKIMGTTMPMLECTLEAGEIIHCQTGAMKYMDSGISMKTKARGGIGGFFKRTVSGESGFMNSFEATAANQRVAFGHSFPGTILPMQIGEQSLICQKRSFLACTDGVNFDIAFQKKLSSGFFGGEGFIMQRLHGRGTAFVEIDGETVTMDLAAGQMLKIETGAVAMYEESVSMNVEMVKGLGNVFFGGEGLFLTTLTGPGRIWLQSMSIQRLASEIHPYLPKPSSNRN